jgi:hypothetical protein|tara:strand:+ start:26505 stop:27116 length:612 start_codon:yes stop_codon:yes gene_type:complete
MKVLSKIKFLAGIAVVALLVACSAPAPKPAPVAIDETVEDLNELTMISLASVGKVGFTFKAGDSFAWRRDIIWIDENGLLPPAGDPRRASLTAAVENRFLSKGYFLGINTPDANYEVVVATTLGDSVPAGALAALAQLSPGLNSDGSDLARGTLLIGIARPGSKVFLWRASLQGFVAEKLTPEQRSLRFNALIASVLAELPES